MAQIEQTYTINAPLEKVWHALTTAEGAEEWGAGPAKFDATEGGEFSYWDGDIHGINAKIIPLKQLEQEWYGHDHPEEKYRAAYTFETDGVQTVVHFVFSGHIYDERRDIADWR